MDANLMERQHEYVVTTNQILSQLPTYSCFISDTIHQSPLLFWYLSH
jgi:hypothetical protein